MQKRSYPFTRGSLVALLLLTSLSGVIRQAHAQDATDNPPPLPPPLALPSADPDEAAALLAEMVAPGGEQTIPALLAAIKAAGFGLLDQQGNVIFAPAQDGQGLTVQEWEVWSMADLEGRFSPTLADFAASLQVGIPELADEPLAQDIVDGLRAHAAGTDPKANVATRFWAHFIVELGKNATEPSNLLGLFVDPATVKLDAVQMSLLTVRFAGDLATFAPPTASTDRPPALLSSGVLPRRDARNARQSKPDCTLTQLEGTIMDATATTATTAFEKMANYLATRGMPGAGTYATRAGWANIALAYLKLVWSLVAFEATIKVERGVVPLERSKVTYSDGRFMGLVGEARFNLGGARYVNCFRIMLNAVGIDFSLWNDGPLSGAGAHWYILRGGATGRAVGIIGWEKGFKLNQIADDKGQVHVGVAGQHQREDFSTGLVVQVEKDAAVEVEFIPKTADIFQDFVDATSTALCSQGNVLIGGVCALPEMLYRIGEPWDVTYDFTVIDWARPNALRITHHDRFKATKLSAPSDYTFQAIILPKKGDPGLLEGYGNWSGRWVEGWTFGGGCEELMKKLTPRTESGKLDYAGGSISADGSFFYSLVTPPTSDFAWYKDIIPLDTGFTEKLGNDATFGAFEVKAPMGNSQCLGDITRTSWITIERIYVDPEHPPDIPELPPFTDPPTAPPVIPGPPNL